IRASHRGCDGLVGFNAKEAHNVVEECVDGVSAGEDYNHNNINQLGKAYKYIVTCKSTPGFPAASSGFWNTTSDGTCTIRWENQTMNCIVNVFAIAIVL
uniref:Dynein light chain Tctex-type 3 n=1 Tax=Rhinopithecus roxellana TaxID=61622 RepID=A0A2K6QWP6_RHIRO